MAATPDLIALVNIDGKRIYNNPAYGSVLEDPDILQGTDSFLDIHPDDRELVKRVFLDSLRTGSGRRIEYRLLDLHGNTRTIESQGTILRESDGKVRCLAIISRDVTERKRADTAFQGLVAGTASATGSEFCTALVRHLANTLNVKYALVSGARAGTPGPSAGDRVLGCRPVGSLVRVRCQGDDLRKGDPGREDDLLSGPRADAVPGREVPPRDARDLLSGHPVLRSGRRDHGASVRHGRQTPCRL